MSAPVFLARGEEIRGLRPGDNYVLTGPEGHHAAVVQRRGIGDLIEIVDGAGYRLRCRVTRVLGRELEVQVRAGALEEPATPEVTIVQGLVKSGAEEAVATLTEVGAERIIPWQSRRAIVKWQGDREQKGLRRWRSSAEEATKQSRRSVIPEITPVVNTRELSEEIARTVAQGGQVFIAHESATLPLLAAARRDRLVSGAPAWVVIGPEGGIDPAELLDLESAGATPVSLGNQVLRAVTAGTVATVLLFALVNNDELD